MKTGNTRRYIHAAGYRPEWAREGILLKHALSRADAPAKSPVRALIATFMLPAGENFYEAIRHCDPEVLVEDKPYLEIWSRMERARGDCQRGDPSGRIVVPHFLVSVDPIAVRRFVTWPKPQLVAEVHKYTTGYCPSGLDWDQLTRRLEACLHVSGFSPGLIAYVNFIDDYAAPSTW